MTLSYPTSPPRNPQGPRPSQPAWDLRVLLERLLQKFQLGLPPAGHHRNVGPRRSPGAGREPAVWGPPSLVWVLPVLCVGTGDRMIKRRWATYQSGWGPQAPGSPGRTSPYTVGCTGLPVGLRPSSMTDGIAVVCHQSPTCPPDAPENYTNTVLTQAIPLVLPLCLCRHGSQTCPTPLPTKINEIIHERLVQTLA